MAKRVETNPSPLVPEECEEEDCDDYVRRRSYSRREGELLSLRKTLTRTIEHLNEDIEKIDNELLESMTAAELREVIDRQILNRVYEKINGVYDV